MLQSLTEAPLFRKRIKGRIKIKIRVAIEIDRLGG